METLISFLSEIAEKYPDNIYLWEKTTGPYIGTTYAETRRQVLRVAAGLLSLGVKHSDRIALLSEGAMHGL